MFFPNARASMRRRVDREINVIHGYYAVKLVIIPNEEICVYVFDERNRFMKLYLDKHYPFKPPQFMISNRHETCHEVYHKLIKNLAIFYMKKLNIKPHGTYCLCCDNLICDWSPGCHMIHLIREFKSMESWFRDLRSAYFGMKSLKEQGSLFKDLRIHIGSYIYCDDPRIKTNYQQHD